MGKRATGLLIPLLAVVVIVGVVWRSHEVMEIESYHFSNTQTWDKNLEALRYETPTIISDAYKTIEIEPPPANASKQTKDDLKQLHSFIAERNPETLARIESERKLKNAYFGDITYGDITSTTTKPLTSFFIQESLHELSFLVMKFKAQYDRVRPTYLDPSLTATIEIPSHPAYPSGHATESYFVALMMSELDPKHRDVYIESAHRIAHGREIAGVHYPSDSRAGQSLATQYFVLLKETIWYKTYFELAQKEW